ncbi:MAG: HAMP domain-containing protein [Alphaproteobacteria bacterium]|nr:HAMP domain-containing protein [Alphaproteobacteria bacterium]
MNFKWLKSILPKGLYGRAALILVLPVIAIQLAVSVVFIQRFFEDVTRQMTGSLALEVALFRDHVNQLAGDASLDISVREVALPLRLKTRLLEGAEVQTGNRKSFDDLTGRIVIETLRAALPDLLLVDLSSVSGSVVLHLKTNKGPVLVQFDRIRVSASNPHQLLVLMIVVSLFMTLISFIFLRNQVRPIRRLARAAEAFGKGRHIPYHVTGATEVRQAGQAFIDMRNRINRQIEQRTLMLSGVSHDLRTPLTRLKLGLSLAAQDDDTRALMRDVDDMEKMLEEFLAFARGDSLEATELVDPVELAQHLLADAKRAGGEVALVLSNAPARPAQVPMRPVAMRRALDNLVTNALRYGSKCEILLEFEPADIIFTIEDNGPGIPEAQREKAMRPFERLDVARNQNRGTGVGLGLAIAMDITSSHGGALVLSDSESLGGLKVELRLPR